MIFLLAFIYSELTEKCGQINTDDKFVTEKKRIRKKVYVKIS